MIIKKPVKEAKARIWAAVPLKEEEGKKYMKTITNTFFYFRI
jgi:hypothetical protein